MSVNQRQPQQATFSAATDEAAASGPVECLGLTFSSDDERRTHFTERLREKLADPGFRAIEGFPIGSDEDILALSDPPYYTACPNPFLEDFICCYGRPFDPSEPYHREPFAADVSEGKNDPIYLAHSYHTKVPPKAIVRFLLHYTNPGDVVLDGFCGTGMTGLAAQMCADPRVLRNLGYLVDEGGGIQFSQGEPVSRCGLRHAVLNDLSPAATFIAHQYNVPVDVPQFEADAERVLREIQTEFGWMYLTLHRPTADQVDEATSLLLSQSIGVDYRDRDLPWARINYVIWSDVFRCQACGHEVVFWDAAVDTNQGKVLEEFECPYCNAVVTKRKLDRVWISKLDPSLNEVVRVAKQVPVLIYYTFGKKRFEKVPDDFDRALLERIESTRLLYWFPTERMPVGGETRRNDPYGLTHVHHFHTLRDLAVIGAAIHKSRNASANGLLMLSITSLIQYASKLSRWRLENKSGPLSGTLYVSSTIMPLDAFTILPGRFRRMAEAKASLTCLKSGAVITSTHSSTRQGLPSNCIDYIFTDPPFGANLMYSELNFLWEAWLRVVTNADEEAVENTARGRGLFEYQRIMERCFQEYFRVLKPGRWMTVEFHNSKNSVWNSIQEAIQRAGFVVADVRTLDKKQGSFKQVTSGSAVKQDLVISAYKPDGGLEQRFQIEAGSEEGVWDFVRTHLRQLPVFVPAKDGRGEVIVERLDYLLFDRMVAFHVQRGVAVPLSAPEFYAGLRRRFPQRDEMFFLEDQVAEYERKRLSVKEIQQLAIFVTNESSAIQWLRQQLTNKPQTQADLTPQFMRELAGWEKHEKLPEMLELLEQNFLRYDGTGPIPAQIVAWMKKGAELRELVKRESDTGGLREDGGLETISPTLHAQARDRWYVPDPNKAIDLEKLRTKALLREFAVYTEGRGKLKQFRTEAVKAGFKQAWADRDYQTIVRVAERLPESVLQEDPDLLMYLDNASLRVGP